MSARCTCRGSFQFLNLTVSLRARVVAALNRATSALVSRPEVHKRHMKGTDWLAKRVIAESEMHVSGKFGVL